ncbi:MAG TPA: hypothetical protein VNW97_11740 [Candidatus Saccharimonadales bacterium]|jgi:hypothetical protein|nr:hypothetical protein [Candidatus Saccharimonadales bacterium]
MIGNPMFDRYIGIDYSGAQAPISNLKGLRVYMADRNSPPSEVQSPPSPRKYWTRRGFAEGPKTLSKSKTYLLMNICILLIVESELKRGVEYLPMHLPDPSYVVFVNAVIASVTAAIGVIRLILEKKWKPRGIRIAGDEASKKTLRDYFLRRIDLYA